MFRFDFEPSYTRRECHLLNLTQTLLHRRKSHRTHRRSAVKVSRVGYRLTHGYLKLSAIWWRDFLGALERPHCLSGLSARYPLRVFRAAEPPSCLYVGKPMVGSDMTDMTLGRESRHKTVTG